MHGIKATNACRDLALLASKFHTQVHHAYELKPSTLLKMLNLCDAWRKPQRFAEFLDICRADSRGRTGFEDEAYPQADYVWQAFELANNIEVKKIVAAGYQGAAIKEQLDKQRVAVISNFKRVTIAANAGE